MLSSTLPVRFCLEFLEGELYPGDVLVANDPYHGGGHLPDFNVFSPVFSTRTDDGGELLLVASIQCHHGDTGGALAGGYNVFAKDIWSEGTRYPLLKIVEAGRERRDVVLTMRANNRLPGFIGDLRSQVGAAQLGARPTRRAHRARTAPTRSARAVDWTIDDTHRRFREEIARWPDGTYEADVYVDSDPAGNTDIHVHVAITVDGENLDRRLRRLRRPPGHQRVVDVRQHARLHDRPAREPRRSDASRRTRASSTASTCASPRARA